MMRSLLNFHRVLRISGHSKLHSVTCAFSTAPHLKVDKSQSVYPNDRFAQVVSNAEKIVGYPTSFMSLRCLLSDEMNTVAMYIRKLVGTKHPLLKIARSLVFNGRYGMQTRGLIVLLLSKAAGGHDEDDVNSEIVSGIHNKQRQLAEIIETIHLANLIHKGIVNLTEVEVTEGQTVKDMEFGNKITVLTGDFLLANACTNLAKLDNTQVVEVVSNSISQMMESNFVYLDDEAASLDQWEEFTFLSRGALLANCCSCALKFADVDERLQQAAFQYGKHLSYAHQIREELRPFIEDWSPAGEPVNLQSLPIIHYLSHTGTGCDVTDQAELINQIRDSKSLAYCYKRCRDHGHHALQALEMFPESNSRSALVDIVNALTSFPTR